MMSRIDRIMAEIKESNNFLLIFGLRTAGKHFRFLVLPALLTVFVRRRPCRRRDRSIARSRCLSARRRSPDVLRGRVCAKGGGLGWSRCRNCANSSDVMGE